MRRTPSRTPCSTSKRAEGHLRALAAVLVAALLAGCSGLFQRALPDVAASYTHAAFGGELVVGAAERDITPAIGGYMSGFDLGRTSTGVASRLKVRALVFGVDERRFAIVGIDNLGLLHEDVLWIKSQLVGFAGGDVFLCASHTHAGPDLVGLWGWYMWTSGRDRGYLAAVAAATAAAVQEAWAARVPAELSRATARVPEEGYFRNPNRGGVFDRRLAVVQARARDDGRPVGTLLHMACHPEVMPRRNTELSADFVGELCDGWRAAGQGQAVFVNGALGAMVSPGVKPRDMEGCRKMGAGLVELAEAALERAEPLPVAAIEVRRRDVYIPLTTMGLRLGRLTCAIPREMYEGRAKTSVGWLRIGDLQVIAVPGEMEPALAERIRGRLGVPDLLVFGLCDDELGYLMRGQDARDDMFAYERSMSPCLDAGEIIAAEICGDDGVAVAGPRMRGSAASLARD